MICYSGLTALFLFLLAKAAPGFLPTSLYVAPKLFPFRQAQYVQVFPLKPAPFCKLFAGLGSTNKSATSLLFSSYLTLVLSSPPCLLLHVFFSLNLSGRSGRNYRFSSCSIRLQWVPGHSFLPENDSSDELARRGALLVPPTPLIFRIHSCFFSDWRRTVSSKFFDTQVSSFSTEEIVLPRHVRYVLSRLRCKGHSLLLSSYLFRIGRIENSSCSACRHSFQDTSHLILHCQLRTLLVAHSLATLCLYKISAPGPGKLPSFCGLMVFRHSPSLERGRVTTTILRDR